MPPKKEKSSPSRKRSTEKGSSTSNKSNTSNSKTTSKKNPSFLERVFSLIGTLIQTTAFLSLAGFLLSWAVLQYENQTLMKTPLGSFISVGPTQRKLNYICLGPDDAARTVWVVPGTGTDYTMYLSLVMEDLHQQHPELRICSYARSGHLWSELWANATKHEEELSDLKEVITQVTKTEKLALVGHSMGGILAAHFAIQNPGLLERVILVDPVPTTLKQDAVLIQEVTKLSHMADVMTVVGLIRVLTLFKPEAALYHLFKERYHPYLTHETCKFNAQAFVRKEYELCSTLAEQVKKLLEETPTPLSVPVRIFLSEIANRDMASITQNWKEMWSEEQLLPKISPQTKVETVPGSDHYLGFWPLVIEALK